MTKQKNKKNHSSGYQPWIDAQKRFHLSQVHVQMARELGMNPKKLGNKANQNQEPWKAPLHLFIEELYLRRFGKTRPDEIRSVIQIAQDRKRNKADHKAKKEGNKDASPANSTTIL